MSVRDIFKTILGIVLTLSGIAGGVLTYMMTKARLSAVTNNHTLMLAADVLMIIFSAINIVCGIITLMRRTPRKVVRVRPFVQVSCIFCVLSIIISSINGIRLDHLFAVLIAGVIIPEAFFLLIALIMARK